MTAECSNTHPEHGTACEVRKASHRLCTGFDTGLDSYVDWTNPDYRAPSTATKASATGQLAEMADRVAPAVRAGDVGPRELEALRALDAAGAAGASLQEMKQRAEEVGRIREAESGFTAGLRGSEDAAGRWDERERELVDDAILRVCRDHAGGGEFTTDAVWAQLAGAVPVTKGMTARLMVAVRDGLLENSGRTDITDRGDDHDHGQRLTVWRSLVRRTA